MALPRLEASHISYFNPQVDEWYEELIEIERRAKDTARIMLIIIDKLTRSVVAINEAVEHICSGRRLVLVIEDIEEGATVEDEALTPMELEELNLARARLRTLAQHRERQQTADVHLCSDIASAMETIVDLITNGDPPKHAPHVPRLRKRSSVVLSGWSRQCLSSRRMLRSSSLSSLASVVRKTSNSVLDGSTHEANDRLVVCPGGFKANGSMFLGGDLARSYLHEHAQLQLLRDAGIAFSLPQSDYLTFDQWKGRSPVVADRYQDIETKKELAEVSASRLEPLGGKALTPSCAPQLILFVIPRHTRSIVAMAEAVELMLSHGALLLVIEPLEEGFTVEDGHQVLGREFKDLARARAYLRETAERSGIQVFTSVMDAVACIVA